MPIKNLNVWYKLYILGFYFGFFLLAHFQFANLDWPSWINNLWSINHLGSPFWIIHLGSSILDHPSLISHIGLAILDQPSWINHHRSFIHLRSAILDNHLRFSILDQPSQISYLGSAILDQPSRINHFGSSILYNSSWISHLGSTILYNSSWTSHHHLRSTILDLSLSISIHWSFFSSLIFFGIRHIGSAILNVPWSSAMLFQFSFNFLKLWI